MTNIERSDSRIIDRAIVAAVLRQIARFDIPATAQVKPHQKTQPRPRRRPPVKLPPTERDTLSPGFRRVHLDGCFEREPKDNEPFTIVERKGDFEYCTMPVFRSSRGIRRVKPFLDGPWDIVEGCDVYYPLPDGTEQGWWVWIRLAKGARKVVQS